MQGLSVDIIDPMNRTGKITVPMHYISETRGLVEDTRSGKELSLCLLFQKGRCNAGARCHQIHAEPAFIEKLRAQASAGTACCALHGDFHSSGYLSLQRNITLTQGQDGGSRPLSHFGRTQALDAILKNSLGDVKVSQSKICRLHMQGRCKFGKDCKNIHMCPLTPASVATVVRPVQVSTPQPQSHGPTERRKPLSASASLQNTPQQTKAEFSFQSCGLSSLGSATSSASSTPPEKSVRFDHPLDLHTSLRLDESVLFFETSVLSTHGHSVKSPTIFDPKGFEATVSALCEDLLKADYTPLTSPQWQA
jgi:hypothetical protein